MTIIKHSTDIKTAQISKAKLKQATLARWQEVAQNKVVNNKSVMAWLDSWGTTKEKERPACKRSLR